MGDEAGMASMSRALASSNAGVCPRRSLAACCRMRPRRSGSTSVSAVPAFRAALNRDS